MAINPVWGDILIFFCESKWHNVFYLVSSCHQSSAHSLQPSNTHIWALILMASLLCKNLLKEISNHLPFFLTFFQPIFYCTTKQNFSGDIMSYPASVCLSVCPSKIKSVRLCLLLKNG